MDNGFLNDKTIIIYWPFEYKEECGGIMVLHYIGQLLKNKNINVKMYAERGPNEVFSDFTTNVDSENIITIYPEVITGNPLNSKYVIRWILAEVGKNIEYNVIHSWNHSDLVYYYLSEKKIIDSPEKIDSIYKFLSTIYLKPKTFVNYHQERNGYCHIFKKAYSFHKNGIQTFHPPDSVELTNFDNYTELVDFFNRFKYFICYDPACFLVFLAGLCGCIPILHPVDGISKEQWFTGQGDTYSAFYEYYKNNEYSNYPGIAYGIEDVPHAESTIHLLPEELNKQIKYINNRSIDRFIVDIQNFDKQINTVGNNY